jgi:hypothetical protein
MEVRRMSEQFLQQNKTLDKVFWNNQGRDTKRSRRCAEALIQHACRSNRQQKSALEV